MKKRSIPLLALILALGLSGCRERAETGELEPRGAVIGETESKNVLDESSGVFPVVDEDGFEHMLFEGDNTSDSGRQITCGTMETIISRETLSGEEPWERSIWYDDSVTLTKLLINLDYGENVCKCLPEYSVKTEFGKDRFGVNLTLGYVRYREKQVSLTKEQVELIRDIIDRSAE